MAPTVTLRTNILKSVFTEDEFYILQHHAYEYIYFIGSISTNKNCLIIEFYDNYIKIGKIEKCSKSGSELLGLVERVCYYIPDIKYIKLSDKSELVTECGINIPLSYLKILTTGQSWYNSRGYFSNMYTAEQEHNTRFIDSYLLDPDTKITGRLKNAGETLFPMRMSDYTVKEYLNAVLADLGNRFDQSDVQSCLKYDFLKDLIQILKKRLIYSTELVKQVKFDGGENKRKSIKPKRKSRRSHRRKSIRKSRKH